MCNFSNLTMPSLNVGKMFFFFCERIQDIVFHIVNDNFTVNDKVVSCLH